MQAEKRSTIGRLSEFATYAVSALGKSLGHLVPRTRATTRSCTSPTRYGRRSLNSGCFKRFVLVNSLSGLDCGRARAPRRCWTGSRCSSGACARCSDCSCSLWTGYTVESNTLANAQKHSNFSNNVKHIDLVRDHLLSLSIK